MVYHRLLGQNETGRQRYVRQAGSGRGRQVEDPGLLGCRKHQPDFHVGPCSPYAGRDDIQYSSFEQQHEPIQRQCSGVSVVRLILQ